MGNAVIFNTLAYIFLQDFMFILLTLKINYFVLYEDSLIYFRMKWNTDHHHTFLVWNNGFQKQES